MMEEEDAKMDTSNYLNRYCLENLNIPAGSDFNGRKSLVIISVNDPCFVRDKDNDNDRGPASECL